MAIQQFNWPLLRLITWAKRLTLAHERSASALESLASLQPSPKKTGPLRQTVIEVASVEAWNAKWKEEHPETATD